MLAAVFAAAAVVGCVSGDTLECLDGSLCSRGLLCDDEHGSCNAAYVATEDVFFYTGEGELVRLERPTAW